MIQLYNHKLFNEIYDDAATFLADYKNYESAIDNLNKVDDKYVTLTWQLITSKYGNTPIRSDSESQFKVSVFSVMFSEAPTFVERLNIQKKIRELTDADLIAGSASISNAARNPDTTPTTGTLDELPYINLQNTTKQKRGKLEAYAFKLSLLETDLSETYIRKFEPLFARVYVPAQYIYPTEEEQV